MPTYLISRWIDPFFGIATGVMAYYLWENDPRNASQRPNGRDLNTLLARRFNNQPPPDSLYAGPEAASKSIFSVKP